MNSRTRRSRSLLGICGLIAAAIAGLFVFRAAGRRSHVHAQEA
jgi:hypothetical protein